MHGSCAGNIKQIFIMFGFVSSAVCIGEDDFIKFQAFGHPDGSDRDAVLKTGTLGSEEMDFKFFRKQIKNCRGPGICFCDDPKRRTASLYKMSDSSFKSVKMVRSTGSKESVPRIHLANVMISYVER